jgi:hypothetical protein
MPGNVTKRERQDTRLHDAEFEPEVRDWLASLSDSDFKRVDEVCGMLAEKGTELGGPWSDHLDGPVWELRIRLRDVAARIRYWCTAEGAIVLLTVFRKTRQHDQRQIDRAVRAQKACEREHPGPRRRPTKGRCDDRLPHPLGPPARARRGSGAESPSARPWPSARPFTTSAAPWV